MIDRFLAWFWIRVSLSASVPDRSLRVFRWIFGSYLLLFDAPYYAWIDRTPDAFFDPPLISLPYVVGRLPPSPFFLLLDVVAIVALCTMTIGYRIRTSTIIVLGTRLVSTSFAYSFGKISHQIAISAVLFCMIVANWGESDSPFARQAPAGDAGQPSRRTRQGVSLLAVVLAFGFITAGIDKARYWVNTDFSQSGILSWYYPSLITHGRGRLLGGFVPGLHPALLKLADSAAALLEMTGFVALLIGSISWRVWLLLVSCLHLANALVLNITFATQVVIYLAFVNIAALASPRLSRLRVPAMVVLSTVGLWHIVTRVAGRGSGYFPFDGTRSTIVYDLYVCVAICLVVIGAIAVEIVRLRRSRRAESDVASIAPVPDLAEVGSR